MEKYISLTKNLSHRIPLTQSQYVFHENMTLSYALLKV